MDSSSSGEANASPSRGVQPQPPPSVLIPGRREVRHLVHLTGGKYGGGSSAGINLPQPSGEPQPVSGPQPEPEPQPAIRVSVSVSRAATTPSSQPAGPGDANGGAGSSNPERWGQDARARFGGGHGPA